MSTTVGREVSTSDTLDWLPGDRFTYKPVGGKVHWHEVIRVEDGIDLPTCWSRCLSGVCDRRS